MFLLIHHQITINIDHFRILSMFSHYPLVNWHFAIEHGHGNSEFSHQKWWIFPSFLLTFTRPGKSIHQGIFVTTEVSPTPRGARAMHQAALLSARSAGPAWTLRSTPGVVSPGAPGLWRKYRDWNFTSIITSGWWLTYSSEKYENCVFHSW